MDETLRLWADNIDRLDWAALLIDRDWRLVYVSEELRTFQGRPDDDELGMGRYIGEALARGSWLRTVDPEGMVDLVGVIGPFVLDDLAKRGMGSTEVLPPELAALLDGLEPAPMPAVYSGSFGYVSPHEEGRLPSYTVNYLGIRLHDDDGSVAGWMTLFFMGVRPGLMSLLARGDEQTYERMARLVEPGPRQAAILFCDLHRSVILSRRLPTSAYFRLVRDLWTEIDRVVAVNQGIVGKHAGDGASAFFLVDELGTPSAAAAAAVRTAREIHDVSAEVFRGTIDEPCQMKIGVHWGGGLYMGQLVPGGRLDVTALGDEVNETARIQECAHPNETLVSKQLVERLTPEEAAAVGLDPDKLVYEPLAGRPGATVKAVDDAGGIPVVTI